jgi:hypothetical protein
VQCTVADESACGGKSCNPATKACTNTTRGTLDYCMPCLADSECNGGNKADPDARCVPMQFKGVARAGGFCLRRQASTCSAPYTVIITTASLSGAAVEKYCGIDQAAVTCEAVVDLFNSASCAKDEDCGCKRKDKSCLGPGQGGLCRTLDKGPNLCTYACGQVSQCWSGTTCSGAQPYCH